MFKTEEQVLEETCRAFTEAQGIRWHQKVERTKHGLWRCECGDIRNELSHFTNVLYDIETIKAAIQEWPCGKCGGAGYFYKDLALRYKDPCGCIEGRRNMWLEFLNWHIGQCHLMFKGEDQLSATISMFIYYRAGEVSAEIMSTPLLLMQAFLAYLGAHA
jgi:hypothetical protein